MMAQTIIQNHGPETSVTFQERISNLCLNEAQTNQKQIILSTYSKSSLE